ncbi:hypothetical protein [Butyrivibrio sp. AE2032]|uniref:hypothetical protein n=1 Tax=Butyrivibrio sp. AE2032 TaxID=1458463 RepID=UPI00068E9983|nr:hypothetical protein [Butyrivibrio sp. AE2032]
MWDNINECGCDFEDVFAGLPQIFKVHNLKFINESYKTMLTHFRLGSVIVKALQRGRHKLFKLAMKVVTEEVNQIKTNEEMSSLRKRIINKKRKRIFIESYNQFYGDVDLSFASFNKDVVERVDRYKGRLGTYDAMHIRRTDNEMAIKNSPTYLFYDKMEELIGSDDKIKVYVATDDEAILKDLKDKYPQNVYSEATKAVSRRTSEGIQFALYEMLILAGAKNLYASYYSTFSSMASCIGRNNITILKKESSIGE